MFIRTTLAAAALSILGVAAWAQSAATPAASAATPRVDQRQANQERRIDQGAASGQLTRRETRRLQREQAAIDRAENRAKADGVVTPQERKRLHGMQDQASKDIARQKHDRQQRRVPPAGPGTGANTAPGG
jgi:hypothetical protein